MEPLHNISCENLTNSTLLTVSLVTRLTPAVTAYNDTFIGLRVRVTLQLTVSQSFSQSVLALSPSGTHDQVLAVVKTVAVLFLMARPP
jgi:hypothetical protein